MPRTGVGRNIRRDLIKTPSRRHFESKRTSKTGSTSKIGSRNGFVRFGKFGIFRSLSPYGVLNSVHKLTVTYYGEITIEPILNPEFDVDHDFEVKNGCFQSLFPRFRVISACSTGRASHSGSPDRWRRPLPVPHCLFRRDFHTELAVGPYTFCPFPSTRARRRIAGRARIFLRQVVLSCQPLTTRPRVDPTGRL